MPLVVATALYDLYGGEHEVSSRASLWGRLRALLAAAPLPPVVLFTDFEPEEPPPQGVELVLLPLEEMPAFRALEPAQALPERRCPTKDTKRFMQLICCKTGFARLALERRPDCDAVAFVDAGITKVLRDPTVVAGALARIQGLSRVLAPGCWPLRQLTEQQAARGVCWRFCGGFFAAPRHLAGRWDDAVLRACSRMVALTGMACWEVSIWALAELAADDPELPPPLVYMADHDDSMFTALPDQAGASSRPHASL